MHSPNSRFYFEMSLAYISNAREVEILSLLGVGAKTAYYLFVLGWWSRGLCYPFDCVCGLSRSTSMFSWVGSVLTLPFSFCTCCTGMK